MWFQKDGSAASLSQVRLTREESSWFVHSMDAQEQPGSERCNGAGKQQACVSMACSLKCMCCAAQLQKGAHCHRTDNACLPCKSQLGLRVGRVYLSAATAGVAVVSSAHLRLPNWGEADCGFSGTSCHRTTCATSRFRGLSSSNVRAACTSALAWSCDARGALSLAGKMCPCPHWAGRAETRVKGCQRSAS